MKSREEVGRIIAEKNILISMKGPIASYYAAKMNVELSWGEECRLMRNMCVPESLILDATREREAFGYGGACEAVDRYVRELRDEIQFKINNLPDITLPEYLAYKSA